MTQITDPRYKGHPWKPPKYMMVEEELERVEHDADLGRWIDQMRKPNHAGERRSWQTVSRELFVLTGQGVSHETLRAWATKWTAHTPFADRGN